MHPTGVASAAWVFAASTSKTFFYVAGAVLAGWAVMLAAFGAARPGFPTSGRQARLVMLSTFVLVATTMTAAVVTAGESGAAHAHAPAAKRPASFGAASTLELAADPTGQLSYDKKQATLKAGAVAIHLVNKSPLPHNVTIAAGNRVVAVTKTIQGGAVTATTTLKPGDYVFYCSVDAHRAAGMVGKLTVTPG
jgi:plastocyanin